MGSGPELKVVLRGTHRTRAPEDTWELIRPLLRDLGISRVADVTWLDDLGIPVFQAIHPRGRSFAVSQGKGLTRDLARVSAVMEGIEGLAAERAESAVRDATATEMAPPYDVGLLALPGHAATARRGRLDWCEAVDLRGGATTGVPAPVVSLDWTVRTRWAPRVFPSTSDGLASGNTHAEAALHGLLELVERHAVASSPPRPLDLAALPPDADDLAVRITRAGAEVAAWFHPHPTGLPVFSARILDRRLPVPCDGSGCHLDAQVALCRAITEAAQSRATLIAGSRDDLSPGLYRWATGSPRPPGPRRPESMVSVEDVRTAAAVPVSDDVATDLRRVVGHALGPEHPHVLAVDLSVADGVHVVKVVVPTLPLPEGH